MSGNYVTGRVFRDYYFINKYGGEKLDDYIHIERDFSGSIV